MNENRFYMRKRGVRGDLAPTDFALMTGPVEIDRRALEPARGSRQAPLQLPTWRRLVQGVRRAVFR